MQRSWFDGKAGAKSCVLATSLTMFLSEMHRSAPGLFGLAQPGPKTDFMSIVTNNSPSMVERRLHVVSNNMLNRWCGGILGFRVWREGVSCSRMAPVGPSAPSAG